MVSARGKIDVVTAYLLAFGHHFYVGLRCPGRFPGDFDWEPFPTKHLAGKRDRLEDETRLGTSGERDGVDGDAELLRLPDGARHTAQVLVTVRDEQKAGNHAGRQRGRAVANGRFQICAVSRRCGGVM